MIADHKPFLQIATKFGLNNKTVGTHGQKHVLPFIEKIETQAQVAVLERVMKYRDEVNLPLPEKSKAIENRLWAELEGAVTIPDRMAVVREINKQQVEQAKLSGSYQESRPNKETIEKALQAWKWFLEDRPQATEDERSKAIARIVAGHHLNPSDRAELAKRMPEIEIPILQ